MRLNKSLATVLKEIHASMGDAIKKQYKGAASISIETDTRYLLVRYKNKNYSGWIKAFVMWKDGDYEIYTTTGEVTSVSFDQPLSRVVDWIVPQIPTDTSNVPSKYLK